MVDGVNVSPNESFFFVLCTLYYSYYCTFTYLSINTAKKLIYVYSLQNMENQIKLGNSIISYRFVFVSLVFVFFFLQASTF